MALVKYGIGITQMSGSIAGNTFARNRAGNYCRCRTKPVNPNTTAQQLMRTIIGYLTQRWHDTLSTANRLSWTAYANAVQMKNKLGENQLLSGFNMYIRYNAVRMQCQNSKADSCLGPLSLPEKDPTFAIIAYASDNSIRITFDTNLPWTDIAASVLGLWAGMPKLITRNYFGGPWKYAGAMPGNQTSPYTMTCPWTIAEGQKLFVYARIATGPTDGRLGERMFACTTVAAAPP